MILNLTQHSATTEQLAAGVVDLDTLNLALCREALTFQTLPTMATIRTRARFLASLCVMAGAKKALIGGAPYLMAELEQALLCFGVMPVYSFSERVSVEKTIDGRVVKVNEFKHIGFVEAN